MRSIESFCLSSTVLRQSERLGFCEAPFGNYEDVAGRLQTHSIVHTGIHICSPLTPVVVRELFSVLIFVSYHHFHTRRPVRPGCDNICRRLSIRFNERKNASKFYAYLCPFFQAAAIRPKLRRHVSLRIRSSAKIVNHLAGSLLLTR